MLAFCVQFIWMLRLFLIPATGSIRPCQREGCPRRITLKATSVAGQMNLERVAVRRRGVFVYPFVVRSSRL
jgi:hypothetical protein